MSKTSVLNEYAENGAVCGIITKGVGGLYTVRSVPEGAEGDFKGFRDFKSPENFEPEEFCCKARGIFRYENITPLVGDYVIATRDAGGAERERVIDKILPRKNSLIRPAVANLTHLFIVIPAACPKPDLITVDKLVSIAEIKEIEPVIVVNKADIAPEYANEIKRIYKTAGFSCFTLSAADGTGCDALFSYFLEECEKRTVISSFAGASAAGKSTLLTRLFPTLELKTGDVSRKTQRGRHTTRHAELFCPIPKKSFLVADTPGFSLLDFTRFNFYELSELPYAFREFRDCIGKCRYTKCTHLREEGCAVIEKVKSGEIPTERHRSYMALYEEIRKVPEWKRRKGKTQD